MILRPPRSTLFPYRRSSDLITALATRSLETAASGGMPKKMTRTGVIRAPPPMPVRSEEHTSELQSHVNLVCRLLLEKKKTQEARITCVGCGGRGDGRIGWRR